MSIFKFEKEFLTADECDLIIDLSKENFIDPEDRLGRPSRSTYFHTFEIGDSEVIDNLRGKISSTFNIPIEGITHMQVNRYQIGEGFPSHYDYANNLYYTFLIYLNDNFTGGETQFSNLVKNIVPRKGKAICWSNFVEGTNELEYLSLHEALPVLSGEKWMIITWITLPFPY